MSDIIKYKKPRIAVIGEFSDNFCDDLERIFPSIHRANTVDAMSWQVNPDEIDLVLFGQNAGPVCSWGGFQDVIHFETYHGFIDSLKQYSSISCMEVCVADELSIPDSIQMSLHRQLKETYRDNKNNRWYIVAEKCLVLVLQSTPCLETQKNSDQSKCEINVFLQTATKKQILACEYIKEQGNRVIILQNTKGKKNRIAFSHT